MNEKNEQYTVTILQGEKGFTLVGGAYTLKGVYKAIEKFVEKYGTPTRIEIQLDKE